MIIDERFVDFINSYNGEQDELTEAIRSEAVNDYVPIIRREMESFLRVILALIKPANILELGTAVGYSSIIMAKSTPASTKIITIENYDKRIAKAKENFERARITDRVSLVEGDANEELLKLKGSFDFVFMDAAKGQYMSYLEKLKDMMPKGAVLITDNVLCDGEIIESRYAVTRRNRTIHTRMREYLYELTHSDIFDTTIIPIGDGITMSIRK